MTEPDQVARGFYLKKFSGLKKLIDKKPEVVDAHAHLYDWRQNRYSFLEKPDFLFQALIGDYSSLPRVFGLDDYLKLNPEVTIRGLVWHEFVSADPVREVAWAQELAGILRYPWPSWDSSTF